MPTGFDDTWQSTEAEHAAQEAVREREARARAEAQTGVAKPGRLVVRSADEFEF